MMTAESTLGADGAAARVRAADVLVDEAAALSELGRHEDAIAAYDAVVARYAEAPDPALRESAADALMRKGAILEALADAEYKATVEDDWADCGKAETLWDEALTTYDEIAIRYEDDPEPTLRTRAASALVSRACLLADGSACDEIVERYGEDPDPQLREQAARALVAKIHAFRYHEEDTAVLATYDELCTRYQKDPAPAVRDWVPVALYDVSVTFNKRDRPDDEFAAYEGFLARCREDPQRREEVVRALRGRAEILVDRGRMGKALFDYDEAIERLGDDPEPDLRELAATTRIRRGLALGLLDKFPEAVEAFEDVIARYGDDPELCREAARAMLHKARALRFAGRIPEAAAAYDDLIARHSDTRGLRDLVEMAISDKAELPEAEPARELTKRELRSRRA